MQLIKLLHCLKQKTEDFFHSRRKSSEAMFSHVTHNVKQSSNLRQRFLSQHRKVPPRTLRAGIEKWSVSRLARSSSISEKHSPYSFSSRSARQCCASCWRIAGRSAIATWILAVDSSFFEISNSRPYLAPADAPGRAGGVRSAAWRRRALCGGADIGAGSDAEMPPRC